MSSSANNTFHPNAESTQILYATTAPMATGRFHVKLGTHRLPRTREMLESTLTALDSRTGVTLQAIKKCIANTYLIDVSVQRWALVKKYLRELQSEGLLINVTGHGLVGHLRLVRQRQRHSKTKQQNKEQQQQQQPQRQQQQLQESPGDELSTPPNQSLALQANDTLCYAPLVQHDPQAHANSLIHLGRVDTPRTSLRGRPLMRHLLPPVSPSQVFELEEQLLPAKRHKPHKKRNAKK